MDKRELRKYVKPFRWDLGERLKSILMDQRLGGRALAPVDVKSIERDLEKRIKAGVLK